jgi:hypothetical protein
VAGPSAAKPIRPPQQGVVEIGGEDEPQPRREEAKPILAAEAQRNTWVTIAEDTEPTYNATNVVKVGEVRQFRMNSNILEFLSAVFPMAFSPTNRMYPTDYVKHHLHGYLRTFEGYTKDNPFLYYISDRRLRMFFYTDVMSIAEVNTQIMRHMRPVGAYMADTPMPDPPVDMSSFQTRSAVELVHIAVKPRLLTATTMRADIRLHGHNQYFLVADHLLRALTMDEQLPPNTTSLKLCDIMRRLTNFIKMRAGRMYVSENPNVISLANTPLEHAFNMHYIHTSQIPTEIRYNLIYAGKASIPQGRCKHCGCSMPNASKNPMDYNIYSSFEEEVD